MTDFTAMDAWSEEEIAAFKEEARFMDSDTPALGFDAALAAPAAANTLGRVVAEGDSWFDYLPGTDLIDCLRRLHGYRIDNYAKGGDTLENMIYGTRIDRNCEPKSATIVKVLKRIERLQPKVFLFSGGGNDVAGDEFAAYFNHKESGLPVLRESYLSDVLTVSRKYLEDLIAKVASVSSGTHIVMHGYGRTVPTGEGVDLLFVTFAGPWLKPALVQKRILDEGEQRTLAFTVIDRFNEVLADLAAAQPQFHHVDLRDHLDPDQDWANELHLKNSAYGRAAQHIDEVIQEQVLSGP